MKIKNIYESVYSTHLLLIYDCTAIEAENYLNTQNIITNLRRCTGQTGSYIVKDKDREQSRYYIYIEKGKLDVETIVHEICHLCFMSLFDLGIKITQDTDDIFCYYVDWWVKQIKPFIHKFN